MFFIILDAQSTITDEAAGEYGKPFSTKLFGQKDYSKELDSGNVSNLNCNSH